MNLAREWTAFAGSLFALMGVSLAAAARRNTEDALSWERQWRQAVGEPPDPTRDEGPHRASLIRAYRAGGVCLALIGLSLLLSAATGHVALVARSGVRDALVGGVFFTVCGLLLTAYARLRGDRRGPHFLDGELLAHDAPAPPGERVADACSRGIIGLFLAFGLRLLAFGLR